MESRLVTWSRTGDSLPSTNKNSAWGSTDRLISHGQATRSTLTSLRVIHFIFASGSPGICELDGKATFIKLWRIGGDETGKALARSVDHEQIAVRAVIPAQPDVGARGFVI